MAWSPVAGATLAAEGASPVASPQNFGNLGAAVQAGDQLIAIVGFDNTNGGALVITGITDSLGNTWARDLSNTMGSNVHEVWRTISAAGTPSAITVAFTGASWGASISVKAYRGLKTSGALVLSRFAAGTAAGTNASDSGTTAGTTPAANLLKSGGHADDGRNVALTAGTLDTTYTLAIEHSPSVIMQSLLEEADSGVSGSTARATATNTGGTGGNWGMAVLVYDIAATVAPLSGLRTQRRRGANRTPFSWSVADSFSIARYFMRPSAAAAGNVEVTPGIATLALTGLAPQLQEKLTPSVGALILTGLIPVLNTTLTPTLASLVLTASTPQLQLKITPTTAALVLSAIIPQLRETITPAIATLTLGAQTPAATVGVNLQPAIVTLTLSGATSTVSATAHVSVSPSIAALTLSGQTPTANVGTNLQPTTAALILSGLTPTATVSDHQSVSPIVVALTLATFAPQLRMSIPVTTATLDDHQATPTANVGMNVQPSAATLTMSGATPSVTATANVNLSPAPAALVAVDGNGTPGYAYPGIAEGTRHNDDRPKRHCHDALCRCAFCCCTNPDDIHALSARYRGCLAGAGSLRCRICHRSVGGDRLGHRRLLCGG